MDPKQMFPKHGVRWLATLALAATTLLIDADTARADAWSWLNGCSCSNQPPATGWVEAQPVSCLTRPFWMRPTPPYNSSWARVPVTNYRPLIANDPLSGVSVTSLQPCHTYEWQMRRTAGCSLWQDLVDWWRSRHCCIGAPLPSPAISACTPASEWVVGSAEPEASPYYAPSTNSRVVPVPPNLSPSPPAPADRRPQLDPVQPRTSGDGSASRLSPLDTEIFVRTFVDSDTSLELVPPQVNSGVPDTNADISDDLEHVPRPLDAKPDETTASLREASPELIPVGWSIPTNDIWDDTGWRSEQ
ncbi:MAG: hypothetical protein O3C40_12695 [Planctomycetota bacterium]|nr:hypothetical protein [Planctomycetota bacterium]